MPQGCSRCGRIQQKTLSQRWHSCPCGAELQRHVKAARVILKRGFAIAETLDERVVQYTASRPIRARTEPSGSGEGLGRSGCPRSFSVHGEESSRKTADEFLRRNGHIPSAVGALQQMHQAETGETTVGLDLYSTDAIARMTIDPEGNVIGFSLEHPDSFE